MLLLKHCCEVMWICQQLVIFISRTIKSIYSLNACLGHFGKIFNDYASQRITSTSWKVCYLSVAMYYVVQKLYLLEVWRCLLEAQCIVMVSMWNFCAPRWLPIYNDKTTVQDIHLSSDTRWTCIKTQILSMKYFLII